VRLSITIVLPVSPPAKLLLENKKWWLELQECVNPEIDCANFSLDDGLELDSETARRRDAREIDETGWDSVVIWATDRNAGAPDELRDEGNLDRGLRLVSS